MAAHKDIHPRWQDERVEEEWDLFTQLASDCSTPPDWRVPALSFREETPDSPRTNRGFKVLGVPLGHPDFVEKFLEGKIAEHRVLLDRIPEVPGTQSAWLLLSYCAAPRANFHLRVVNPHRAEQFAAAHDEGVWQCLCRILKLLPTMASGALLSVRVGLASAVHVEHNQQPIGPAGQKQPR